MRYRLLRLCDDGEWYEWGIYDLSDIRDVKSMVDAAAMFGAEGLKVKVELYDGADTNG